MEYFFKKRVSYTAKVTAQDDDGGVSTHQFTVEVLNLPPQIQTLVADKEQINEQEEIQAGLMDINLHIKEGSHVHDSYGRGVHMSETPFKTTGSAGNETIIEGDMTRLAPEGVETHFVRSKMPVGCTVENLASMQSSLAETSKEFMPEFELKVVCYACTSGSVVIGEENVEKELLKGNSNRKPTTLITGAIRALQALSAKRIVMATPYTDDINTIETRYLESKGFELLNVQGLNLTYDSQITSVKPNFISKFAKAVDHPDAEAIFISCGALRTLDVIEEIEQSTGKPVVTSNCLLYTSDAADE